jgi:hypothetical protein
MRLTAYQTLLLSVLLGALLVAFLWGEQEDAPVITIKLLAPEVLIAEPILMKLTFYNPTDKPIKNRWSFIRHTWNYLPLLDYRGW